MTALTPIIDLTARREQREQVAEMTMSAHVAAVSDWHDQQHRVGTMHVPDLYQCSHPVCSSLAEALTAVQR